MLASNLKLIRISQVVINHSAAGELRISTEISFPFAARDNQTDNNNNNNHRCCCLSIGQGWIRCRRMTGSSSQRWLFFNQPLPSAILFGTGNRRRGKMSEVLPGAFYIKIGKVFIYSTLVPPTVYLASIYSCLSPPRVPDQHFSKPTSVSEHILYISGALPASRMILMFHVGRRIGLPRKPPPPHTHTRPAENVFYCL